jgi:hypothetical protein
MEHRVMTYRALFAVALTALLITTPHIARAAGTGDDPSIVPDVLTYQEQATKIDLEYDTSVSLAQTAGGGTVTPLAGDAPHRLLNTPSHKQERSYWCGPATVQVIVDWFGTAPSQTSIASYLGTTSNGTSFSKVDDGLRHYTGRTYYYYGSLSGSRFNSRVCDTIGNHGWPLAADVSIDADVWPNYNYDHAGHIIPIEGFDWRSNTIRINDVYDEAASRSGGGNTYGHTTYSRDVIWAGVYAHPQRAVVSAP